MSFVAGGSGGRPLRRHHPVSGRWTSTAMPRMRAPFKTRGNPGIAAALPGGGDAAPGALDKLVIDHGHRGTGGNTAKRHPHALAGEMTRFFQIGFSKCGTTSLAAFFNRCGIPCVHNDRGRLARRMRENLACGKRALEGYEQYLAFTDLVHWAGDDWFDGFLHYRALDTAYGGRFILNTRPLGHWLKSVAAHDARRDPRMYAAHCLARFGTTDPAQVERALRRLREDHHRRVREEIGPDRLLVFDIESDPPERLCEFIGVDRSMARHWRRENPSPGPFGRMLSGLLPRAVRRAVPQRVKAPFKRMLRARR